MKVYLEPYEVKQIEGQATCLRDRLLVRLLFRLGCRVSEAVALKVDDIDFTQRTVTIEHLKTRLRLFCPNCSARLGKAHAFCPKCSTRVEKVVTQERVHRRLETLGREITVKCGSDVWQGCAEAVDDDGSLLLRRPDGSLLTIAAGDVTLRA